MLEMRFVKRGEMVDGLVENNPEGELAKRKYSNLRCFPFMQVGTQIQMNRMINV